LSDSLAGRPCGAGGELSVRSDGLVQPCAQLNVSMGQIGAGSKLSDIATSNVAQFFREVTWADFPGCRECDLRIHCRRCFASAVAEVGDMLAPYGGACELAIARYQRSRGEALGLAAGDPERPARTGPFRLDSSGNIQSSKARYTAHDDALVNRYPWLRQSRGTLESSACSVDSSLQERGLIQLRRSKEREQANKKL